VVRTILATPPVRRVVPSGVFDAFGWCASDTLEWRRPERWSPSPAICETNPARMVFVTRETCDFLPLELARLHAPGIGLTDEWALAPYGIDDATDELYARRVPPGRLLWLAADDLAGLVWGLHDWAHFHNHGPFDDPPRTELQADLCALAWLWLNRREIGIDDATWEEARRAVVSVAAARFSGAADDGALLPWLTAPRVIDAAREAAGG
jgi:hypothetical protein